MRSFNLFILSLLLGALVVEAATAPRTLAPTQRPSRPPTKRPTFAPTKAPTFPPTRQPTLPPTTSAPTVAPTRPPTISPTVVRTQLPTTLPSFLPTVTPTVIPTVLPTCSPTLIPTMPPTLVPTHIPTETPTQFPTTAPTLIPTLLPTESPSQAPSLIPTLFPSLVPSKIPSQFPSEVPSFVPSENPTEPPTSAPTESPTTFSPTDIPTAVPSSVPTELPTFVPSMFPTEVPTKFPTLIPTQMPSAVPTKKPTAGPTLFPTLSYQSNLGTTSNSSLGFTAQIYPSTSTAWILPGGWPGPAATAAQFSDLYAINTSAKVKQWEVAHADFAFGGDYGVVDNKKLIVTGYMYNQMLNFDPAAQEMWMRLLSLNETHESAILGKRREINYEDFFLHFSEDTEFPVADLTLSSYTSLNGVPWVFGYTNGPTHAGFSVYWAAPWNIQPWQYYAGGGMVYVMSFEKFDEIQLNLDSSKVPGTGSLVVEYVSATYLSDYSTANPTAKQPVSISTLQAKTWSRLAVVDTTVNLTTSGAIRWKPPVDWQIAAYADGSGLSYGGGQFFGNGLLSQGGVAYAVRLRWKPSSASTSTVSPTLNELKIRRFIRYSNPSGSLQIVPGWDAANDINQDGYVDDQEYANLQNPKATARMRHESRAYTIGQMWSQRSSGCRVNAWNEDLHRYIAKWNFKTWTEAGLQGAYNDDLLKMLGPSVFPITKGGKLAEAPASTIGSGRVNDTMVSEAFQTQFTKILALIRTVTKSKWLSGNISGVNLFASASSAVRSFITVLDVFLREEYLTSSIGLTGYFGVQKMWDIFAYSAVGKVNVVQGMIRYGAVRLVNATTPANWQRDLTSLLAQYYLINVPKYTTYQSWGNGYYYGSANTYGGANFYISGVPMNIAYQPTRMLKVDIGIPKTRVEDLATFPGIASGVAKREFMAYQTRTSVPLNDYTVIGFANESRVVHPEVSTTGFLDTIPSMIYYLQRSAKDHPQIKHTPIDCVLAREYTKGLVLYRTDVYGNSLSFMKSSVLVTLPKGINYRRIRFDGSLDPIPVNGTVTLFGYEGAIFVAV